MSVYQTRDWQELRRESRARDPECALGRILGGGCHGSLHTHHIEPIAEGGPELPGLDGLVQLCARHHRVLHGLRNKHVWRKCRKHRHPYPQGRRECEERLNRG